MSNQLAFQNTQLSTINRNGQTWLSSSELAKALQYSNNKAVTMIYNKHNDEFTSCMTQVLESSTSGNYIKKVRYFSLRGCHLIAMFSRTKIAKEFRRWVLDILDRESGIIISDETITHAQEQELIRAINRCVERIKAHCEDISDCLCKRFNINKRSELPASKLEDAYAFLSSITKRDVVGTRYLVEVKITDYMFNGEKTIYGKCDNFNALLTGLAKKLGYSINELSENNKTLSF